ncbi:MAG: ATP-binding protein [Gammaproteobacteria bacterium]|nr:ATP-binding protein [Gammaproteobacteria bacterium]
MQTLQAQSEIAITDKAELQAAFQLFSQMSDQLESSYRDLELRVERLTKSLALANSEKLKQLAEKEKLADRLEALHAAMPAAVIWVDQSHTIRSANQTAKDIFKDDIVGMNWELLLEQQFSFNGHQLVGADASVYSYNQRALEAEQGQVIILTDVSLSHKLQQSSYRQTRLAELGEITAGLAHQVRTPLASALLSIEQLSHPDISDELRCKSTDRIKNNLHHLDQLVNDMLLFARDGEFENDQVSIRDLLHSLDLYFKEKDYEFFDLAINEQNITDHDIVVAGSRDALLSVLISLVENTHQLVTGGLTIKTRITLQHCDGQLLITVKDNGPGLDALQCQQIFKPFYTTKSNGTGLGLAISQSIIHAHHGSLTAVSEQGRGTAMQIRLHYYQTEKMLHSKTKQINKKLMTENYADTGCLKVL